MKKTTFIILLISILYFNTSTSQFFQPKGSLKVDVSVPIPIHNKSFKLTQKGLANLNIFYQHSFKGFVIGGGIKYIFFLSDEFALQERITGGMHQIGGFTKIGYERFIGEKTSIDLGIRGGYLQTLSKTTNTQAKTNNSFLKPTWFIEPTINFSYLANEVSAFSFFIGYNIQFIKFTPEFIGLTEITLLSQNDNSKTTQFLSIGFGYSYFFGKKEKKQKLN